MLKTIVQKVVAQFKRLVKQPEINAAQSYKAAGGEAQHAFWMFATPVNMLLGRDSYFLSDPDTVNMTPEESVALMDSLNMHFAGLGYGFYQVNSVWYLGLDKAPDITTTSIEVVKNQDVGDYLPQGEGGLKWDQLQNEIQMLLFSHPVNQQRESQGLAVINSLWCYGLAAASD